MPCSIKEEGWNLSMGRAISLIIIRTLIIWSGEEMGGQKCIKGTAKWTSHLPKETTSSCPLPFSLNRLIRITHHRGIPKRKPHQLPLPPPLFFPSCTFLNVITLDPTLFHVILLFSCLHVIRLSYCSHRICPLPSASTPSSRLPFASLVVIYRSPLAPHNSSLQRDSCCSRQQQKQIEVHLRSWSLRASTVSDPTAVLRGMLQKLHLLTGVYQAWCLFLFAIR